MSAYFLPADILLPDFEKVNGTKWATVACDQYTSEPEYWEAVETQVGDAPSALRLILPEVYLGETAKRVPAINASMKEILKDCALFETSGGGVTFSGGECMLQIDFLEDILKECKQNGIHTAVDTAGHLPWSCFERILPYTDLFLYDVKSMDEEIHRRYVGVDNGLILENLAKLLRSGANIWVRTPIVAGVNDHPCEMQKMKQFFAQNGYPQNIELLPYHSMGEHKYAALGRTAETFDPPNAETIQKLKNIILTEQEEKE